MKTKHKAVVAITLVAALVSSWPTVRTSFANERTTEPAPAVPQQLGDGGAIFTPDVVLHVDGPVIARR
jgi:hypothetical protein